MNRKALILVCSLFSILILRGQNVLTNGGFESSTVGNTSFLTNTSGNISNASTGWQLSINPSTCSGGCATGSSEIVNTTQYEGSKSLYLRITKHTNRNDIRLFQVIPSLTATKYILTFSVKSDMAGYSMCADVLKNSQASSTNGAAPFSGQFSTLTTWKKFSLIVDLATWTSTELTNARISIRPNTGNNALPTGPYPKDFWFDNFSFKVYDPNADNQGSLTDLKNIALQVAEERRVLAANAGFSSEASALSSDIATLQSLVPTTPPVPTKAVGFNPAPTQTTAATNPFITSMHAWAANYLSQSFPTYAKATTSNSLFTDAGATRNLGDDMERLQWLLTSPLSNYRYNGDLFYRFLHLVYVTSDDYYVNGGGGGIPGSTANAIDDWFAGPPIAYSWWMSEYSFNQFIPNTLLTQIRSAADKMGNNFYSLASAALPLYTYVNRDISYGEILMYVGLHRNNTTWQNYAKTLVDATAQNLLPDGAYKYYKSQNEVVNYHGGTIRSLAKIWEVSEYQPAWDAVAASGYYELLTIEPNDVPEYYTVPAWKTQWNTYQGVYSGEALVTITRNPYVKSRFDTWRSMYGYEADPMAISFYDPSVSSASESDNYMVYDRNIQGARARYGRFSYAFTTRDVSPNANDVGHQTMVGAMTTVAGSTVRDELDGSLMCVHPKVHVRTTSGGQEWTDWAYMFDNVNPKTCLSATVSAMSSTAQLQYQGSGPNGFTTDWGSFQQWISLPDRLIGYVETYPTANTTAIEIDGRVRFTYGRSNKLNPKRFVIEQNGVRYRYGNMTTIIHGHNYSSIDTANAGVLRDETRQADEIRFRSGSTNSANYTSSGFTKKYFIVEIRQADATGDATVQRTVSGNVNGLIVKLNGKSYASFRNLGASTATVNLQTHVVSGNGARVFYPRGDSENMSPLALTTPSVSVAANEQVLVVSSNDGKDLAQSWSNYPQVLSAQSVITPFSFTPLTLPVELVRFTGQTTEKGNLLTWTTAQERNAAFFIIERSNDAYDFTPIGKVKATNTTQSVTYQFEDKQSTATPQYYRLRMVDNDGTFKFSNTISLVSDKNEWQVEAVYPTPTFDMAHIDISSSENSYLTLVAFDILGRELLKKEVKLDMGFHKITLSSLPEGAAFIKIFDEKGKMQTLKLVKAP